MGALRRAVRHAVLSTGGMLPADRGPAVRFFYGHSMAAGDVPNFRRSLRALRKLYEFVRMEDALALLREPERRDGGRYLAFSFDDGFRDNYDLVAPILEEFGARACFFVSTNFIDCDEAYRLWFLRERVMAGPDRWPMTWSMLRQLRASGHEIGAHTEDHLDLGEVDEEQAVRQVLGSKARVEREVGPCALFAWPYGRREHFPPAVLQRVRASFTGIFSAIRSPSTFSYGSSVVNRDHFEPSWPALHVRFFARAHRSVLSED